MNIDLEKIYTWSELDDMTKECKETMQTITKLKYYKRVEENKDEQKEYQRKYYLKRKDGKKHKVMFINIKQAIKPYVMVESKPILYI